MNKLLIIILLLLSAIKVNAQHKIYFEPNLTAGKTPHSLYNAIKLIDSRPDTSLGVVETGAFNRKAILVTRNTMAKELAAILTSLTNSDAANNNLLLHLRQFSFAEVTGMGETGYCAFQADLYAQKQDKFRLIASVDTLFMLRSSIDVTNGLLRQGSDTLTGFIKSNLLKQPADTINYSYNDIAHIDSIEKRSIKLYTTPAYTDGLYLSYRSFKDQTQDKAVTVTAPYLYPGNVKALDDKGKLKDVKLNKSYAVVHKGIPYIVTQYGFYPLTKTNNDFFFTGKAKVSLSAGTLIVSSMFGLLGGLMTSGGDDATFEMKIDHRNGALIKLKEIKEVKVITPSKGDSWD